MDNQNTFAPGNATVVTPSFTPTPVSTPTQSVPEPRREQTVQQLGTNPTSQPYTLEDLESPSTANLNTSNQAGRSPDPGTSVPNPGVQSPEQSPDPRGGLLKKILIGAAIIGVVVFLSAIAVVFIARNRQAPEQTSGDIIPDQQVDLSVGQAKGVFDLTIEGQENKLIVNGSVVSRGDIVLTAASDNAYGQISAQNLNGVYTYLLPNAAGTFCLDSNNCNYLQETDVTTTTIAGAGGALALGDGLAINGNTIVNTKTFTETAVNNFNGAVTIQGTTNQVNVANNGGVITLSTPQDLATTSAPTFNALTVTTSASLNTISLASEGLQNGFTICDSSNNCGYAGGADAFVQDGNDFGETAVLGTNGAHGLAFETNNTVRMTIDVDGNVDIEKSLELGSVASGPNQCSTVLGTINCRTIFDIGEIYTESTVAVYGMYNIVGLDSAGPNVGGAAGGHNELLLFGNNNYHATYYGGQNIAVLASTGSVATLIGHGSSVYVESGTATNIYGAYSSTSNNGSVTNAYGTYIGAPTGSGTIQNSYGLYVANRAGTGTNSSYNIYSAGSGRNLFEGHVGIGNASAPLMGSATLSVVDTITTSGVGIANAIQVNSVANNGDNRAFVSELNTIGAQNYDNSIGAESTIRHSGTGTVGAAVALGGQIVNEDAGAITFAVGLGIASLENSGGGSVLENYGAYIQSQTAATDNYGLRIDTASTQTLWLAGDEGTANSGIAFGSTRDTNLYRSAADTLKTDDSLHVTSNVGIGTAPGTYKLNVATDAANNYVANFFNDGNNANRNGIRIQAGADDGSGATTYIDFLDGDGTEVGYCQNNAGTFACADSSDARTKTNIGNSVVDAEAILNGLRVVDFNRLQNPDGPKITGFIAQEVQELYGQAVSVGANGYLGVARDQLVPILVMGHQNQEATLTDVNSRVSALEQHVDELLGNQSATAGLGSNFAELNVSGNATIRTLTVAGGASIDGSLSVSKNATFAGNITVQGHIIGNQDTRGVVTMPAGKTEVQHTFAKPYNENSKPNIILTATNTFAPSYRVESDENGFTVYFQNASATPVKLNYQVQQ